MPWGAGYGMMKSEDTDLMKRRYGMKRIILAVMLVALSCYILGCGNHSDEQNQDITGVVETEELATEQTTEVVDEVQVEEAEVVITPTKEEVLAMRAIVLTGMSEEEIKRLKENIKIANLQMEEAYLYDDLFARLEDKEDLYWNYFDEKGDIQIGWEDGSEVMTYNRFDAYNFMVLMSEMKESVENEKLRNDIQYIIDETALAAETHEMRHANNIYKALHDMDYFLLRYGIEDVGKYTADDSIVSKYYGVLSVYAD